MFDAPRVYREIPDLAIIYDLNDEQRAALVSALDAINSSIFLDKMGEYTIARWEKVLKIVPTTTDTVESRRFRVKSKIMERLPYSYRVIMSRLKALFPGGFDVWMDEARTVFRLTVDPSYSELLPSAYEMLDQMLPLNMSLNLTAEGEDIAATVHIGGAVVVNKIQEITGGLIRPVETHAPLYYGAAVTANITKEV